MNRLSAENPLWSAHLELLHGLGGAPPRPISVTTRPAERADLGEWSAPPPGRLGRRLLPEVERYLEFFALTRG